MVTLIDMISPEGRVDQMDILDSHIPGIRHVGQTRTLGILVGALAVPLTTNPELLPILQTIAIDSSPATDGKAIKTIGIDEG